MWLYFLLSVMIMMITILWFWRGRWSPLQRSSGGQLVGDAESGWVPLGHPRFHTSGLAVSSLEQGCCWYAEFSDPNDSSCVETFFGRKMEKTVKKNYLNINISVFMASFKVDFLSLTQLFMIALSR